MFRLLRIGTQFLCFICLDKKSESNAPSSPSHHLVPLPGPVAIQLCCRADLKLSYKSYENFNDHSIFNRTRSFHFVLRHQLTAGLTVSCYHSNRGNDNSHSSGALRNYHKIHTRLDKPGTYACGNFPRRGDLSSILICSTFPCEIKLYCFNSPSPFPVHLLCNSPVG